MNQDSNVLQVENEIERKELIHNGYTFHYYASGNSNKEFIGFLHPAFADNRGFEQKIDFFSSNYRGITMDMPGHGLSQ